MVLQSMQLPGNRIELSTLFKPDEMNDAQDEIV